VKGARGRDDIIIGGGKIGHIEHITEREFEDTFLRDRYIGVSGDGEMHGNRRVGIADCDWHGMVLDQQAKLLGQVTTEQVRPCDGGGIGAGAGDMAKGQARVGIGKAGHGQADFGVERTHASGGFALGGHIVEVMG
jgi:hypothetical protein